MTRLVLLGIVLLSGCYLTVNSRAPFYTEEARASLPALRGEWWAEGQTWMFTGDRTMSVRVYGEEGSRDQVVVPFQAGGVSFVDFCEGPGQLHNLYAVAIQGRGLTLSTLDGDWLTNAIARGAVVLPTPETDSFSNVVFTASAPEWVAFLEQHATNSAIYAQAITFSRSPNANFVPARRRAP